MSNTTIPKGYSARPKAGKPGKYEMYLKAQRQHDRMNFSGQFTSAMGMIGQTDCHQLMALEVVKAEQDAAIVRETQQGKRRGHAEKRKAAQ